MLKIKELTKKFNDFTALDRVSITIEKGHVYGLLGPNGAGKTTLIKHICGIYRQNSGEIELDGEPVFENPKVKERIVYISDDLFFFTQYTILDMAKYYERLYPNWSWDRFNKLREIFPLDLKKRIAKFSKGMQKQAAFWLSVCTIPDLLLLDEPVDGLDPVMRRKVWNIILQDVLEREVTVLISSHNLRELEDVCDRVGILHNGKLILNQELDSMKSTVHKIQLAYPKPVTEKTTNQLFETVSETGIVPDPAHDDNAAYKPAGNAVDNPVLPEDMNILHRSVTGSIMILIVRGDREEILSRLRQTEPLVLDILPLTLEEIFIYEVGDLGYEIQDIIV